MYNSYSEVAQWCMFWCDGTGTVGTTDNQLYYPVAVLEISCTSAISSSMVGRRPMVGCYGPAMYQFYYMQSVAFDSQGAMYVSRQPSGAEIQPVSMSGPALTLGNDTTAQCPSTAPSSTRKSFIASRDRP